MESNSKLFENGYNLLDFNKSLFDWCLEILNDKTNVIDNKYHNSVFGSWYITTTNHRLVYDGKDSWLILQESIDFRDFITLKREDVNKESLAKILDKVT